MRSNVITKLPPSHPFNVLSYKYSMMAFEFLQKKDHFMITDLGIQSRKIYYSSLQKLEDAGLIVKVSGPGHYRVTVLGKIAYKLVQIMNSAIQEKQRLEIIDKVGSQKIAAEIAEAIIKNPELRMMVVQR